MIKKEWKGVDARAFVMAVAGAAGFVA